MSYTSTIFRILNYDTLSDEDKSIMIDVINKWETIITSTPDNVYVDLNIYISTLGSGVLGGATLETVYQISTQTYIPYVDPNNSGYLNPSWYNLNLGD